MKRSFLLLMAGSLLLACSHDSGNDADHGHSQGPGDTHHPDAPILEAQIVAATDHSPEYIQHASKVEILTDVKTALQASSNTFTHEGHFGPLLFGENLRAFYIRLEPGMFLAEHPHPTESIVYTVSGRWVLCSEGKRQVMEAGNVFHFGSNAPTGWEAPFPEGAFLFIVKQRAEGLNYETYTKDIRAMAEELEQEMADGGVFYYNQLEPDHPAIQFARQHNPDFDQVLAGLSP